MKRLLAPILLLTLLFPTIAFGETMSVAVQLQCDGLLTIYNDDRVSKPSELPNTGISIEIRGKTVLVDGSFGWDGKFKITRKGASSIFFQYMQDKKYFGSINRNTGNLQLVNMSVELELGGSRSSDEPKDHRVLKVINARCRPAKPLF